LFRATQSRKLDFVDKPTTMPQAGLLFVATQFLRRQTIKKVPLAWET